MSAFYNSTFAKATAASALADTERKTRSQTKAMLDALKKAISDAAEKGFFSVLLSGSEDLNGTSTVRVFPQTMTSSTGTERVDFVCVGSDVFAAVKERFVALDFDMNFYASGIERVSWRSDKSVG